MQSVEVGLELARKRRQAGLTQLELAERLGTSQPAVSRVEGGLVMPGIGFVDRWARLTGGPITLTLGLPSNRRSQAAKRVRRALGDFESDAWRRNPTAAERRSLEADGLAEPALLVAEPPRPRYQTHGTANVDLSQIRAARRLTAAQRLDHLAAAVRGVSDLLKAIDKDFAP